MLTLATPGRRLALACLVLLAVLVAAAGCNPKTPPPSADPTGAGGGIPRPPDPSRPTLTSAATALEKRDPNAFAVTLSVQLREAVGGALDLAGPGAIQLAKALRDARLIAEYDTVRVYETTVDGETYTFRAVKEGDKWLLAGL